MQKHKSPDQILQDLGCRVAELRADSGRTQEQLAEQASISIKYLQRIEGGRENLTVVSLAKIADLFGVDVEELFRPPRDSRRTRGRPLKSR